MVLRSELLAALSEGEAKAVEFSMLELQLCHLKEQLISSNTLLKESIPRSELMSFKTNIAVLFRELKEFVSSFHHEAKLLITSSISRVDEMLADTEICRSAILEVTSQGINKTKSHLGSAPPASNSYLNPSNHEYNENSLLEENFELLGAVHHTRNQGHFTLGSAPPSSNDGLSLSANQFDGNSMSEENLDMASNISTGESVKAHSILKLYLPYLE